MWNEVQSPFQAGVHEAPFAVVDLVLVQIQKWLKIGWSNCVIYKGQIKEWCMICELVDMLEATRNRPGKYSMQSLYFLFIYVWWLFFSVLVSECMDGASCYRFKFMLLLAHNFDQQQKKYTILFLLGVFLPI